MATTPTSQAPPTPPPPPVQPVDNDDNNSRNNNNGNRSIAFWVLFLALLLLWGIGWRLGLGGVWIHLLLVLGLIALMIELITWPPARNITASTKAIPKWDAENPAQSLAKIHRYVIKEAGKSTGWYWTRKRFQSRSSRTIRFSFWLLAAVGGLLPIIGKLHDDIAKSHQLNFADGLWASLLIGVAAALLGLDKAFGFSSGWARYVMAASNIRKLLEEFRLDWADLMAKASPALKAKTASAEVVAPLLQRAQRFRSDVEAVVLQETKDWVTEFQSTMAQMDKEVAAQLATLKTQVEKTTQEREATKPGSVHLAIDPKGKTITGTLKLTLMDSSNKVADQADVIPPDLDWISPFVPPGLYQVKLEGTVNGALKKKAASVTVKPGETGVETMEL